MKQQYGLKNTPNQFTTAAAAISYAAHSAKLWAITIDSKFFAVVPADASKLLANGAKLI